MNYVDYNFNWLTKELKGKTKEEILEHIKNKYLSLSKQEKKAYESYFQKYPYWGKLSEEKLEFEQLQNKAASLHDHLDDFIALYQKLKDYRSKKLLYGILMNWYDYDFNTLKSLMDPTYCQYFDLDLLACNKEVFVDVGAYIGDTTLNFIHSYGENSYEKIYCYEINPKTFEKLKENVKKYPHITCKQKAVAEKNGIAWMKENEIEISATTLSDTGIEIQSVSLDEDIKEKITLLKMDIEGGEEKALIGAKEHIKNDHPNLLISVYHNHEDIWKLFRIIDSYEKNYTYYLRYYGNYFFPTEIVLYGIYSKKEPSQT